MERFPSEPEGSHTGVDLEFRQYVIDLLVKARSDKPKKSQVLFAPQKIVINMANGLQTAYNIWRNGVSPQTVTDGMEMGEENI